jgi:hypothetical protein
MSLGDETLRLQVYKMNHLSFGWKEPVSLAAELARPINRISVEFAFHGRPVYVTLWRPDSTGLLVHSDMHDLAERREVGVLQFGYVFAPEAQEIIIETSPIFHGELSVSKLIIEESGTESESGIILRAADGQELVIVAGVNPYSVAVSGVTFPGYTFEPEYKLEQYSHFAMDG